MPEKLRISLQAGGNCVDIKPLFSFDSKFILIASGWEVKVVSCQNGECIRCLRGHESKIVSLHENYLNKVQIISCSEDGTLIFWDYTDGIILKIIYAPQKVIPITSVYIYDGREEVFFTSYHPKLFNSFLYACKFSDNFNINQAEPQVIFRKVQSNQNTVAFSSNGDFVVAVFENILYVHMFEDKKQSKHIGTKNFTCVTCHPHDALVATGDVLGRIFLWGNVTNSSKPTKSMYHWHTLPVADLAFSFEGSYLYSGGGECVLVKWNLQAEDRTFVPRMGLPICQVAISHDNSFIATGHEDNAICLVNPQNQVVQCYQGLCQGHSWKDLLNNGTVNAIIPKPVPTGLIYDSKSRALALNGKPGHVQFYSLLKDKQLFSLDISGQNFVTRERERVIANTIVEKVALDAKSNWMATVQCRDDHETSIEIVLKFWKWNDKSQLYSLNTSVLLPHNERVNCLIFQPSDDENPMVASTSNDGKFKIWALDGKEQMTDEVNEPKSTWQCITMGYYRGQPAGDADFSQDGSILVVAFNHAATLWIPDNACMKAILSVPVEETFNHTLLQVKFGHQNCAHLLVTTTEFKLTVWNVISLAIQWQVEMNVNLLARNPQSEIMGVFDKEGTFFAFKPNKVEPVLIKENATKRPIIACTFIPRDDVSLDKNNFGKDEEEKSFLDTSTFVFMNNKQELMMMSLESKDQEDEELIQDNTNRMARDLPRTQFSALIAQQTKSEVEKFKPKLHTYTKGNSGSKVFLELLNIPSHALPSVSMLCLDFMKSLLIERQEHVIKPP